MNFLIQKYSKNLQSFEQSHKSKMALGYAVIAQFFFAFMYYCISLLRSQHSSLQILNTRIIIGYILNQAFCSINKLPTYVDDPKVFKIATFRGFVGSISMSCVFTCLSMMNISDGVVLFNTNPIWTNFLAYFFLGEKLSKKTIILCLLAFIGIILVYRPTSLFGETSPHKENPNFNQLAGSALAICGSLATASGSIIVRKLSHEYKMASGTQMQYYYFVSVMTSTILLIINLDKPYIISFRFVIISILLSLSGFIGQLMFTRAFALEKASIVSPLGYLQVVLSFISDIFLSKADVQFTSLIGAGFIVLCSIGIAL